MNCAKDLFLMGRVGCNGYTKKYTAGLFACGPNFFARVLPNSGTVDVNEPCSITTYSIKLVDGDFVRELGCTSAAVYILYESGIVEKICIPEVKKLRKLSFYELSHYNYDRFSLNLQSKSELSAVFDSRFQL
jgi:hypothetical protein